MIIENKFRRILYYDKYSKNIYTENCINPSERITKDSLTAHLKNSDIYIYSPDEYNEVLNNIVPIPPHTKWEYDGDFTFIEKENIYKIITWDKNKFLDAVSYILKSIKNKNIAVQFSGGLDSSIVIGILNYFDIYPLLIGMRNDRYEFRTERIIQDKIAKKNKNVVFIDDERNLPFSMILNTPKHFIPCTTSLFCPAQIAIANVFKQNNIDILLYGMGFDSVFCLKPNETNKKHWLPWMFNNTWFSDYIYSRYSVNFQSGIYSRILANAIWNLRSNEEEDNKKNWARQFFKEFIPSELYNYKYKADHVGLYIDGIKDALNDIKYLFEFSYKVTKFDEFSFVNFKKLFTNYHIANDSQLKEILANVSFAVWLYANAPTNT
jgi:hypothetical protein